LCAAIGWPNVLESEQAGRPSEPASAPRLKKRSLWYYRSALRGLAFARALTRDCAPLFAIAIAIPAILFFASAKKKEQAKAASLRVSVRAFAACQRYSHRSGGSSRLPA